MWFNLAVMAQKVPFLLRGAIDPEPADDQRCRWSRGKLKLEKKVATIAVAAKVPGFRHHRELLIEQPHELRLIQAVDERRMSVRKSAAVAATEVPCPDTSANSRRLMRPVAQLDA